MPEHQQIQQSTESKTTSQKQTPPRMQAPISHPIAIIQRARMNQKSLTHADVMQLQRTIGNRAVVSLLTEIGAIPSKAKQAPPVQRQELVQRQEIPEEEEPLQGKFENKPEIACPSCFAAPIIQRQEIPEEEPLQGKLIETVQRQEIPEEEPLQTKKENNTGMPDNLKAGVESLSGIDMSDVRVHYNSDKPAEVGALAYTQGTNIHVASGQERHLPHEAWHVVQQAQGRVKPTMQMRGLGINDNPSLEHEADMIGAKTAQFVLAPDEMLQRSDIHVGSQGEHIPHGAWHMVQQKFDKHGNTVHNEAVTQLMLDENGRREVDQILARQSQNILVVNNFDMHDATILNLLQQYEARALRLYRGVLQSNPKFPASPSYTRVNPKGPKGFLRYFSAPLPDFAFNDTNWVPYTYDVGTALTCAMSIPSFLRDFHRVGKLDTQKPIGLLLSIIAGPGVKIAFGMGDEIQVKGAHDALVLEKINLGDDWGAVFQRYGQAIKAVAFTGTSFQSEGLN